MPIKTITLKDAVEFAKNNGYLFAIYKKEDNNYKICSFCYTLEIDLDTEIIVKTTGAATDFNEFTTKDKEYCFRLHNNYNLPNIIPIIKKD